MRFRIALRIKLLKVMWNIIMLENNSFAFMGTVWGLAGFFSLRGVGSEKMCLQAAENTF
jgi:hypothetical protein